MKKNKKKHISIVAKLYSKYGDGAWLSEQKAAHNYRRRIRRKLAKIMEEVNGPSGVICPYCKKNAEFVSNEEVYGKTYGNSHMIWLCRDCNAYVGTHKNQPGRPLGTLANRELRRWRMAAHAAIDPLWQSGPYKRREVYNSLDKLMGTALVPHIHIGACDIEQCKKIIEIFKPL